MLWFSERYLRYELVESQYIAALTLEPESARAMLRQVVKRDAALRETPTPKYLAALAEREESDLILPTYERACKADPNNPFTALRYGCRLFEADRFTEAHAQFQRAAALLPDNTWPLYLSAAARPFLKPDSENAMGESLALMAKANNNNAPLIVPRPLWTSAMPERGYRYEKLRRQIVDEFCAPLYRFADWAVKQGRQAALQRQAPHWDSWLETLQQAGERIARGSVMPDESLVSRSFARQTQAGGGSIQATAGIHIALMALDERVALHAQQGAAANQAFEQKRAQLADALGQLNAFEEIRDRRIAADRRRYALPLHLGWQTAGVFFLAYAVAYGLNGLMRVGRRSWTLGHSRLGVAALAAGQTVMLLLLALMGYLQGHPAVSLALLEGLRTVWWAWAALLILFGCFYPHIRLPSSSAAVANSRRRARHAEEENPALDTNVAPSSGDVSPPETPENDIGILRMARGARRIAYLAFMRRYFGALLGLFLCTLSAWAIGYRIFTTLYPWQLDVLTTGLGQEEAALVQRVVAFLAHGTP